MYGHADAEAKDSPPHMGFLSMACCRISEVVAVSWMVWAPIMAALVTMAASVWVATINRRGQSDANVARAEAEFRISLLGRLASLEARVAEQERELIKERTSRLSEQREYGVLLLKYETIKSEVEELRPLKAENEALHQQIRNEGTRLDPKIKEGTL